MVHYCCIRYHQSLEVVSYDKSLWIVKIVIQLLDLLTWFRNPCCQIVSILLGILLVSFKSWVWFPLGHRILTCNTFLFAILLEIQIIMVSKLPRCSDKFLVSNILSRTFRFSSTNLLRKKVLFISYLLSFDQARETQ